MMRKNNKNHLGLVIIIFLVFLFGVSSIIYVDSYTKTLEEQRKETYGAWHIGIYDTSEEVYETLYHHGIVDAVGFMEVCGYAVESVLDDEMTLIGSIGYADEYLIEIGNITLLDGDFPSSEQEVALEASVLDQMGYSYELGQRITLDMAIQDASGEYKISEETFTLCGVVKNYSAYWKSDGYWLISCFVSEQFVADRNANMLYTFAELDAKYMEHAEDLSVLTNQEGYFVKNEFTYLEYSEEENAAFDLLVQQTVIILVSCLFIVIFLNMELKQRYHSFVMMRTLGATKGQIIGLFIRGKLRSVMIASSMGISCGILFPYAIFEGMEEVIGGASTFDIDMVHVLVMISILYVSAMISVALSMVQLFRIPLRGMSQQQNVVKRKCRRRKELSMNHLFSVFNLADWKQKMCGILLTCVASFFIYLLAYQTWDTYSLYTEYLETYPSDYIFGLLASKMPPRDTMSEEVLDEIEHAYGVGEVQAIAVSEYYELTFESDYNQNYAQEIYTELSAYYMANGMELLDAEICGALIGVSDNLIPLYISEIDSGSTANELADGEVILYLPTYMKDENGNLLSEVDAWQVSDEAEIISEDTIENGDIVQVEAEGETVELHIVGIIESFDELPFSYNPTRSYSLICNENTYRELTGLCEYAYVLVYNDETAISYQTDVELSKISTSLYFGNNRVEHSEQLQNVMLQMTLSFILCTFAILIMTVIRFEVSVMFDQQRTKRYQLLYQLGMSNGMMLKQALWSTISESFVGCGMAVIAFLALRMIQEGQELCSFADYVKPDMLQFISDILPRLIYQTDWRFLSILILGIYMFNVVILCIHDYRKIFR